MHNNNGDRHYRYYIIFKLSVNVLNQHKNRQGKKRLVTTVIAANNGNRFDP